MRRSNRGVAAVEFHIVLLALLPLCLGTLQIFLLLVANHQVDYAAFAAARAGATAGAAASAIRRAFTQAILPMYLTITDGVDSSNATAKVSQAYARAAADVALHAQFRVLSPSSAALSDFAISRDGAMVMPNDALEFRAARIGTRSGQTLQEANLLRLSVVYCQRLIVPFAAQLLVATLRLVDYDVAHTRCYVAGRVPLVSEGVSPMQSAVIVAAR